MTQAFHIRNAAAADASAIAALSGELGYPALPQQMRARLDVLLRSASHLILVAAGPSGELIAWLAAEHRLLLEYGERIEIVGLVVASGARRSGVGKTLVAEVEQWTRTQGLSVLAVRSNAARTASHPFYESLGFTRIKTQHSYEKMLAPAG
jgi:GNAT superfamily N-acetyltransferase